MSRVDDVKKQKEAFEQFVSGITPDMLVASTEANVYPTEGKEADGENFENTEETNDKFEIISESEHDERQRSNRANDRIRQLIEQNKQLARQVEELGRKVQAPSKTESAPTAKNIPETIDKNDIFKKIYSQNPDLLLSGIEDVSAATAKKLVKEAIAELLPTMNNLSLRDRARADGISTEALETVYSQHPELKDMSDNGYAIARDLAKASSKKINDPGLDRTRSVKSAGSTKTGGSFTKNQFEQNFLAALGATMNQ